VRQNSILVVGGAGYIGSHSASLFYTLHYHVIILDSLSYQQNINAFPWARVVVGDYGDRALLDQLFSEHDIKTVVHCGAHPRGDGGPAQLYETNVVKTQSLLEAMRAAGVHEFIFSSSCSVYGIPEHASVDEAVPFAPTDVDGRTKVALEYLLHDYSTAYDFRYVSLRYFDVCGAMPEIGLGEYHFPETHLIPLLLRSLYTGRPFSVYGNDYPTPDRTAIRDYVHVRDIAMAHGAALRHLHCKQTSDVFNLGTGQGYSVKEVISAAEKLTEKQVKCKYCDRRPGEPAVLVADPSRAQRLLGWKPQFSSLQFILQSVLKWELKNQFFISQKQIA